MSGAALASMVLIVGTVVGGFVFFLLLAMRKDREKADRSD
jgi:hypothetical protein